MIRGTYNERADYHALDLVAFNGGSFLARKDRPGECPGPDWQLIASPGKKGEKGLPGDRGPKGEPGVPGAAGVRLVGWRSDDANFRAVAKLSDGSELPLDLRQMFQRFYDESR
jgi:hypothetical protein